MTIRSSVYEQTQIGPETTAGTEVNADTILNGLSIGDPSPQGGFSPFRPEGSKYVTAMRRGKEHVTMPYTVAGCYNALAYVLDSLIETTTPTGQGSGPTAYLRTYTPAEGPDTTQTYTVEKGSSVRAWQSLWSVFNSLQFQVQANSEDLAMSGNMVGRYFTDGITMHASPGTVAYAPIQPNHWQVKLATTQAGLTGASALDEALSFSWNIGDKWGPVFNIDRNNYWGGIAERAQEMGGEIMLEANSDAMGWLASYVRSLTPVWLRLDAVGPVINGSYTYQFMIDMQAYFSALPSFSDSDGLYAVNYGFTLAKDATLGAPFQITLRNVVNGL